MRVVRMGKSFSVIYLASPSLIAFIFEADLDGYLFTHAIRDVLSIILACFNLAMGRVNE